MRIFFVAAMLSLVAVAQEIQVNQQNKTISVSATEEASAPSDIAVLNFGVVSFAPERDPALKTNATTSAEVLNALEKVGIKKDRVQTDEFSISETEKENRWTSEEWKQRRFRVRQAWKVEVPASQAEKVTELITEAGANDISTPTWKLSDTTKLQAEAGAAALEKAKRIANEMAKGLGANLGKLIYASNSAPPSRFQRLFGGGGGGTLNTETASLSSQKLKVEVKFFPEVVKETAAVYAVFAIE